MFSGNISANSNFLLDLLFFADRKEILYALSKTLKNTGTFNMPNNPLEPRKFP